MKKFIILVLVILAIPTLAVLFLNAGLGGVPVVSSIIGADKPKDLGVKTTPQSYDNLLKELNIKPATAVPALGFVKDYKNVYASKVTIDREYTQEEISSILSYSKATYLGCSNVQLKLHKDGTIEASGLLNVDIVRNYIEDNKKDLTGISSVAASSAIAFVDVLPKKVPVYVQGTLVPEGTNHVKLNISKADIGKYSVPENILVKENIDYANNLANRTLDTMPNLKIENASYSDGKIRIKGVFPTEPSKVLILK